MKLFIQILKSNKLNVKGNLDTCINLDVNHYKACMFPKFFPWKFLMSAVVPNGLCHIILIIRLVLTISANCQDGRLPTSVVTHCLVQRDKGRVYGGHESVKEVSDN